MRSNKFNFLKLPNFSILYSFEGKFNTKPVILDYAGNLSVLQLLHLNQVSYSTLNNSFNKNSKDGFSSHKQLSKSACNSAASLCSLPIHVF